MPPTITLKVTDNADRALAELEVPLPLAVSPSECAAFDAERFELLLDRGVFSQVGVSVFVRYFFRFWAWVCRPGVFYWFWGLPNMSAWLMRWLCPVNSMSRPW